MKKVIGLELVGLDGNAFALIAAFTKQARREKWTAAEISAVVKEATSKDYSWLIATLAEHCDTPCDCGRGAIIQDNATRDCCVTCEAEELAWLEEKP